MKICIDPGHGGTDPGAIGRDGALVLEEKACNLAICWWLETLLLVGQCFDVIMTRREDRTLSLGSRARHANRHGADLFVSVHANAAATPAAEGMEVFHFPGSAEGKRYAGAVLGQMLERFPGHRDRGVKEAGFAVLRLTRMPAILVECEFLTHPAQLRFLADPDAQRGLAAAITCGVQTAARGSSPSPAGGAGPSSRRDADPLAPIRL